jgi:hypothetical protein
MDQVTPREEILGSGAGGPLTAPTPWVVYAGYLQYPGGVVVGNPTGGNKGPGTLNLSSIYLNGVLVDLTKYLLLTGGTLTGKLTLAVVPTADFDAATKKYVDDKIVTVNGNFANYLPLAGGTLTGALTLSGDPTTALQAATKEYVDNRTGQVIAIADAPSDGKTYGRNNAAWVETNQIDVGTY